MKSRLAALIVLAIFLFAFATLGFAQGKSGGKGNSGRGNSGGGIDSKGSRGNSGNADRNRGKDSDDSFGKNKADKPRNENGSSNRFKGLSKQTGMSEDALRARYEIERRLNPDLTYGQFVAAHMISKKHGTFATESILSGLRNGKSIGQTLHDGGWDQNKIDKERKRIRKDREKGKDTDYDDDDRTWRKPF